MFHYKNTVVHDSLGIDPWVGRASADAAQFGSRCCALGRWGQLSPSPPLAAPESGPPSVLRQPRIAAARRAHSYPTQSKRNSKEREQGRAGYVQRVGVGLIPLSLCSVNTPCPLAFVLGIS